MKKICINIMVKDLSASVEFYSQLFQAHPIILKKDYAKWILEDTTVSLPCSLYNRPEGIDHLDIHTGTEEELQKYFDEGGSVCRHVKLNNSRTKNAQKVEWKIFCTYKKSKSYQGKNEGCCELTYCVNERKY